MTDQPEVTAKQQLDLIWDYIKGFHAVHLIAIGTELGLFEAISEADDGVTSDKLSQRLRLHGPYVDIWCKTACAYALIDIDEEGHLRLAAHMDQLLADKQSPRYIADYAIAATGFFTDDLRRYPEFFKSGEVFSFQQHGSDFSAQIGTMIAGFHKLIAYKLLPSVEGIAACLGAGGKVLDIGCGAGGLVIQIALANPNCRCVGVDVDTHGIELARANIVSAGVKDRVSVELADGSAIGREDEFDVVTMCEVLHELPLQVRGQVLANAYKALKPGSPMFILDETYPSRSADLAAREYNLAVQTAFNELIWGNVVPTAEEQDGLLNSAGFARIERAQIATYLTALTVWKS